MHDLRSAFRSLRRAPVVAAAAILSLGLGIGANTAIFSLIEGLLLRPLPVSEPERLRTVSFGNEERMWWSYPAFDEMRQRLTTFDALAAWSPMRVTLGGRSEAVPVNGLIVSGNFFRMLGVPAQLGRTFTAADDERRGGPEGAVAVIGYGLWQRRFGGASDVIGTTLVVDRVPRTIIGVTPRGFFGLEVGVPFDVAIPLGQEPLFRGDESWLERRDRLWLTVTGRLRRDVSPDTATAALRGVQPQIREAALPVGWPPQVLANFLTDAFTLTPSVTGTSSLRATYARPLIVMLIVAALVLLIACGNIANLLLARAAARHQELSVRVALGASRWQLIRLLLVESALLASIGAVVGMGLAWAGSRLLVAAISTPANPVWLDLDVNWRVFTWALGLSGATVMLFGLVPAFRASGLGTAAALRTEGRATAGPSRGRLELGLIAGQVALSLVLVLAAVLFVRTFAALTTKPLGFDPRSVLIVNVSAPNAHVKADERLPLYARIREAVRDVPGVAEAALSVVAPVGGLVWGGDITVSGGIDVPDNESNTLANFVSPGWFRTFGTPLVAGRDVAVDDRMETPAVAVVNRAFADKFFGDVDPLRGTIELPLGPTLGRPAEIVGVVGDAMYGSLREPVQPTVYLPFAQYDRDAELLSSVVLSVRSQAGSPAGLGPGVAAAVARVHPDLELSLRPLEEIVDGLLAQERMVAHLSAFFGVLALLLAGVGLYGVTAYMVAGRRAEIAIRLALGAVPAQVIFLVLSRIALLVVIGLLAGIAASVWLARFVGTLLYGVEPGDFTSMAIATLTLLVVMTAAGLWPLLQSARLDPARVLRAE